MFPIEIPKNITYIAYNFLKRCVFSADFIFCIESVCLSSEGKELHIVGVAKENE